MKIGEIRVKNNLSNYSKSEFHANRAFTFYELNRWQNCIDEAEKALSFEPEHEFALTLAILSYSMLKNHERSLELGEKALQIHADSAEIHYAVGTAHLRAGHPHPAAKHLYVAVEKNPLFPSYFINLAIAFWNLDKKDKALESLDKALSLNPNNDFALNLKSRIQKGQKNTAEALATINKAIQLNPEDSDNHFVKGEFEMRQRNYEVAANHFKESLRLNPAGIDSRMMYLECLFLSNKTNKTLNLFFPGSLGPLTVHLLSLVFLVLIFNYYAGKGIINTPPQIWVLLLMIPIVFFWIIKPYFKLKLYQEEFGEHPLEDTDPSLPISFNAVIVVLLMVAYLFVRVDFFAWWSGGLVILITIAANVILSENPGSKIPVFKKPWQSFWSILIGATVVMWVFYRLSLISS